MKIFISWSGSHARAIAEVVRTWLDDVFDAAEPFMSQSDILGGTRPLQRIEEELSGARFGVIIVTAANQHAPWITFEAGALSKVVDDAGQYVMPMLVDLRISDLTGPLTQFQAASLDAAGVKKMVLSIGHALGMDKTIVERKVETFWPRLEKELGSIHVDAVPAAQPARDRDEVVDEILTHVRALRQQSSASEEALARAAVLDLRRQIGVDSPPRDLFWSGSVDLTGRRRPGENRPVAALPLGHVNSEVWAISQRLGIGPVNVTLSGDVFHLEFPRGTRDEAIEGLLEELYDVFPDASLRISARRSRSLDRPDDEGAE